jgi:hypothetical protein
MIRTAVCSRLTEVECLRTLDRLRVDGIVEERKLAELRERIYLMVASMEIVELTRPVLARAAQPSATALGTLDAIHLSSALLWRSRTGRSLTMATHDDRLALGARAEGLRVIGAAQNASRTR